MANMKRTAAGIEIEDPDLPILAGDSGAAKIGVNGVLDDTDYFPNAPEGGRTVEYCVIDAKMKGNEALGLATFIANFQVIKRTAAFIDATDCEGQLGTSIVKEFNEGTALISGARFMGMVLRLLTPFVNSGLSSIEASVGVSAGTFEEFVEPFDVTGSSPLADGLSAPPAAPGTLAFMFCPIDGQVPAIKLVSADPLEQVSAGRISVELFYIIN